MNLLLACLTTFLCGALYEAGCVYWVHFAESGKPIATAICSMVVASAQVLGIGESVHDVRTAAPFIAGYGVGTYLAVVLKSRHRQKST